MKTAAFDIDGTITAHFALCRSLANSYRRHGWRVLIVTARPKGRREETIRLLDGLGIYFDALIMKSEFVPVSDADWKYAVISRYAVLLHFDDEEGIKFPRMSFCGRLLNFLLVKSTEWF